MKIKNKVRDKLFEDLTTHRQTASTGIFFPVFFFMHLRVSVYLTSHAAAVTEPSILTDHVCRVIRHGIAILMQKFVSKQEC